MSRAMKTRAGAALAMLSMGLLGALLLDALPRADAAETASAEQAASGGAPVETDMHEFMEYVFQPAYKRLRPAMDAAPSDNQGWKTIKAESLVLAEAANLLLIRQPEMDATDWVAQSEEVRELGAALYHAAREKDFTTARRSYEKMLHACNACHTQFADGEHQLAP